MNKRIFNVAKAVSKTSEYPRIKIGCCIARKNSILSVGVNKCKSHPMQKMYNKYRDIDINHICNNVHAEMDAILKVSNKQNLIGADIYIYRSDTRGNLRICRPCAACMAIIRECGIKNIYYTDVDGMHQEVLL